MNERERWIVYPLLFFALGASLRDKFMQQVSTQELHCQLIKAKQIECEGGIVCEGMVVLDPDNRSQPLVELGRTEPAATVASKTPRRFGALILRDNRGQILCGALDDALYVRHINCEAVRVLDPSNQNRVLAGLGSVTVADKDGKPRPFGVLALNNEDFGTVTGNPPKGVIRQNPAGKTPQENGKPQEPEGAGAESAGGDGKNSPEPEPQA